jgi:hypothetical protein
MSEKKGLPLELGYMGMCTFSTKTFKTGARTISFLYETIGKPSGKEDL